MSSHYTLPLVGSNNPCGYDSTDLPYLPSINCGTEIVFQSVYGNHSSKAPIRIKLNSDEKIDNIRLVHAYSNMDCLYIVSGDGKLFEIVNGSDTPKRLIIDDNEDLEVLQISSYTEAVLFLVRDKISGESFIYGRGHNGYFRMTHDKTNDYSCNTIELMFEPRREMPNVGFPYVINHIGCCYSFSCCVINDTLLHFTGQNWLSGGQTHVDGYFQWPTLIQDLKKPVTKLECGDFHVLALLKDGTVAVGGSNSSNQLTSDATHTYNQPFGVLFSNISNIFSGSNSVLYQSKVGFEGKLRYYFFGAKTFDFVATKEDKKKKAIRHHKDEKVFEQQFTRDFFLHRYEENPEKIYLDGSSYYGSNPFDNTELSLETLMPFSEFNKGLYPQYRKSDFYKNMVKVVLQPKGIFCICDYGGGLSSKMFAHLLKASDYSSENNRLILDIVIHTQH
ncbi:predicted protein [Naegleria gruberi]|uniref:Predicted protein n=1 Tax=Naegleria gruberi TaxID=5762 RepID=D2VTX8_NAEGR|nr:uncharacterized protein NAEGRDRAFT_81211 [Naegleria gruberi]EFC39797.1 predicted protein [Naegleria gruberi]|eukprot:XP_002672541.1 predicted protein [Naegleria gruberi strain NEG-M]